MKKKPRRRQTTKRRKSPALGRPPYAPLVAIFRAQFEEMKQVSDMRAELAAELATIRAERKAEEKRERQKEAEPFVPPQTRFLLPDMRGLNDNPTQWSRDEAFRAITELHGVNGHVE